MLFFILSCGSASDKTEADKTNDYTSIDTVSALEIDTLSVEIEKETIAVIGELEQKLIDAGLVDIQSLDSTIQVELKYSTTDNFLNEDVYGELTRAYLQADVAEKLVNAQKYLKDINPGLSLLVYDAVRPRSVQQKMWDILDMPLDQKVKFVSNPANGSIHNFGAAVDLTIVDSTGQPLDMGAGFDDPRIEAWPIKEKEMLEQGRISEIHISNRKILRNVMGKAGFFNIQSEWWHFNSCYRDKAMELYEIIE